RPVERAHAALSGLRACSVARARSSADSRSMAMSSSNTVIRSVIQMSFLDGGGGGDATAATPPPVRRAQPAGRRAAVATSGSRSRQGTNRRRRRRLPRPRRRPQWADRGGGSGGAGTAGTASSRTPRPPDAPPDAPLPLGGASPDAVVLSGVQRPAQALAGHGAAPAGRLGLLDLCQGRPVGPGREEQLRVFVAAGGLVAPVVAGRRLRRVE